MAVKEKTALITGGSKGIGLSIKKALEKEGIKVISWSRSEGVNFDNGISLQEFVKIKTIDILINNFGGGGTWAARDAKEVMDRNYGLTELLTRSFLTYKKKWGRVVTISSIYGTYPGHNPEFSAAKAAQIMFMKSLAGKHKGITFNCVSPSEVADAGKPKKVELKSKDVAELVAFLCSDKAKFINGQNIVIGKEPWKE
jgi:3-oxoacyl-[acyl-carrier protein] reductase